ncbi:MAG: hypothetical protein U0795_19340 [Pirellulales bacterium]
MPRTMLISSRIACFVMLAILCDKSAGRACFGQDRLPDAIQRAVDELSPDDWDQASEYASLFSLANAEDLRALTVNRNDSVALAAAWETVRRVPQESPDEMREQAVWLRWNGS